MLQDTFFSEGEGDAWYERNRDTYQPAKDPVIRRLRSQNIHPRDILEIGASRGARLAELHERYQASVTGMDPSAAAVADGKKSFPAVRFFVGTAKSLPLSDESCDLIIANGVLCWIDRKSLLASAAEIDRVLVPGGHLLIGDFAPYSPKKVRYHHRPDAEIFTYKQDYGALFLATAGYVLLAQQVFNHETQEAATDISERERFAVTILQKIAGGTYAEPTH